MTAATSPPALGRPVWYDLMSTDPAASRRFYGALLGWQADGQDQDQDQDQGQDPGQEAADSQYTMLRCADRQVAGIVRNLPGQGSAPFWMAYIQVGDVDATCKTASERGGRIVLATQKVEGFCLFAVLCDPQGAVFSVISFVHPLGRSAQIPTLGSFCWSELWTPDPAAAAEFYRELLGWSISEAPPEKSGLAFVCEDGGRSFAGIAKKPLAAGPSMWLNHIRIGELASTEKLVTQLGGQVLASADADQAPGRYSVVKDASGAIFALFESSELRQQAEAARQQTEAPHGDDCCQPELAHESVPGPG